MSAASKARAAITGARGRAIAQASTDMAVMFGGGYLAGRYARNSKIGDYPMPLIAGAGAALLRRRAKSIKGGFGRAAMTAVIGGGVYGAGKVGEKHGEAAGNDGNLFSWSKAGGFNTK